MAQTGHADARLTLSIYAQVMLRQAADQAVIWRLMRFAGEPEKVELAVAFGALNGRTTALRTPGTVGESRVTVEQSA